MQQNYEWLISIISNFIYCPIKGLIIQYISSFIVYHELKNTNFKNYLNK